MTQGRYISNGKNRDTEAFCLFGAFLLLFFKSQEDQQQLLRMKRLKPYPLSINGACATPVLGVTDNTFGMVSWIKMDWLMKVISIRFISSNYTSSSVILTFEYCSFTSDHG